ncbi:hypothetical protein niasHT_028447 [Heterodera trifolii]|uniref:BTB domain-containing protein n=1 Tax=Heterodera trifolii TaxID=157864 RepID=A0ABD2KPN0_9BILA
MALSPKSKLDNLADRMKVLLSMGDGADIHFLVGEEKELFRAHKCILMTASEVFKAMFHFDNENTKTEAFSAELSNSVEVPDVKAAAFRVMLSFIYADDFSELDGDNALAVLYAAKKYGVDGLIFQCLQIPIQNMPNVFMAYAQARLFDLEEAFSHQCLLYICQNAEALFRSEEFFVIDQKLLCELFERDQLEISNEFEIWKTALRWADEKCRQNAIECSAENRRSALGPALFKIRFPLISTEQFSQIIVPSGVLTVEEMFELYHFKCHPNSRDVPLKFSCQVRISDWNISVGSRGTLALEIEEFSEFVREGFGSEHYSESAVFIRGFPWKILAEIQMEGNRKWLGFSLWCTAPKRGPIWSCECSATFRIVSQSFGAKIFARKSDHIFDNKSTIQGFENFITLSELMDSEKGLYDKNEDLVTLAIDVIVKEGKMDKSF